MSGFNVAYFQTEITNLDEISAELSLYADFVSGVVAEGSMSCAQLQRLLETAAIKLAKATLQTSTIGSNVASKSSTMLTNVEARIAVIAPLLMAPTDLPSVITWITNAIAMYAGPNATLLAQEALIVAQAAEVAAAVTNITSAIATLTTTINSAIAKAQNTQGCLL